MSMNPQTLTNIPNIETPLSNQQNLHIFDDRTSAKNEFTQEEPFLAPSNLQEILTFDLQQRFSINQQNLNNFLLQANHIKDMPINMKIFKRYFKVPFEIFPESKEIMEIFSKIIQRIMLTKTKTRNWYYEDVILLVWIVVRYCFMKLLDFKNLSDQDWAIISSMIPSKTEELCKFKWLSINRITLQDVPWTVEEDDVLKDLLKNNDSQDVKWSEVAKDLFKRTQQLFFRSGKICRERWNNYLDPILKKGTWTLEEDIRLLKLVKETGKKWAELSKKMVGRTENSVKNRYNSLMKKERRHIIQKNENYIDISFNSNTSKPSEDIEEELIKTLIVKKEQTTLKPDRMELEINYRESESTIQQDSSLKKERNAISKEHNTIHLRDLGEKKEGNILFELLKFDFIEENHNNTIPKQDIWNNNKDSTPPPQNFNKPAITLNPIISTKSFEMFPPNLNANNNQNIGGTYSNYNQIFNNNSNNNNYQNYNYNNNYNNNPINPIIFNNNNINNNYNDYKPQYDHMMNQINNSFNNPLAAINPFIAPMNNSMNNSIHNTAMFESTKAQLNNYYLQKNMELFEKFLLTNNSNINNYHNFQNLQKMQKNLNNNLQNFDTTTYMMNSQPQFTGQNAYTNMNMISELNKTLPNITDSIKYEDISKKEEPLNNPPNKPENQQNNDKNMFSFKFPNFILPNGSPMLVNPLLQKIKIEDSLINSSSNTSNSLDSFKSFPSSLTSISNNSENLNLNPINLLQGSLNNQNIQNIQNIYKNQSFLKTNQDSSINSQNNQNNDNVQTNENEENFKNIHSLGSENKALANYNVKSISEFNMLQGNRSQLQFAIVDRDKHEIYVCGDLNNFKHEENAKKKNISPINRKKLKVIGVHSPLSKFHDYSPESKRKEGNFTDFSDQ